MKYIRLILPMFCVLMFISCSEAPIYKKPTIPAPDTYKGNTTIWQPAQPADHMSRGEWWKEYHDPTLNDMIVRLDAANAGLAVAMAHFDQATAYSAQAHAGYFPTVSAGAYTTRNQQSETRALRSKTQPNNYGDNAIGLLVNYEVDLWGRVRNQVEAGEAGAQAAEADLESIHLSLRAQLANDYLTLRMLDAQSKLLKDEIDAYSKASELTQNRFQNGIDSALDVSRAKVQLEMANVKLVEISTSRSLYEHAIATLVGESASSFSIVPKLVAIEVPAVPVGIPATLLQRRPDIAAAERRLAEANAKIGIAKSAFFPAINLSAAVGFESTLQSALLSAPSLFWSIGPSALLTIFDSGRRQSVVDQADAVFKETSAQYRSTVLSAFQEVEDNLTLLNNLSEQSITLNEAVSETNHTLDIAMNRYREGISSYLEVVTAQASAQQVQLDQLSLKRRELQASVNLIRALGGGWDSTQLSSR